MKLEIETTWTKRRASIDVREFSMYNLEICSSLKPYDAFSSNYKIAEIILPDNLKATDLELLVGHRTKITIEVLPW